MNAPLARWLPALLGLASLLWSTACGNTGGNCTSPGDCGADACVAGRCVAASGDPDSDGLSNRDELRIGSDPLDPDSDGDGFADGEEAGTDPAHPDDEDGDGRPDLLESAIADEDSDCVPDQSDPGPAAATSEEIARVHCSRLGVCGGNFPAVRATCGDGVPACDY